ncbi:hypothetical protein BDY19DRAFT_993760 [Irpex rosettiformis]|uniref:Uncharacterized protein n=1 Tax=Irpex rosettiformis TaxID=378272 RepID=A0ACB8U426_9APHY|nr:hypothetical protein BDY19DRAFT_993760 [Irpex rosettiformis]
MASFSWSDGLRAALSPCLTCLKSREDSDNEDSQNHNRGPDYVPRARADELEGLLADTDDAETLSLHSNIGQGGRRKKRARRGKNIRLFGFDLFGRPPIHLPEDEDDLLSPPRRTRTISGSTVDSDASPLDPSTIAQLSAESAAQEEADRRAKEERHRRRKEKKARKAALAAALERGEGGDFEGFQGSGDLVNHPSYGPRTRSSDGKSAATIDDFGPFEHAMPSPHYPQETVDEDDADFDALAYSRSSRVAGGSGTGSDSRSRTSGSISNADPSHYNHHYLSMQHETHSLPTSPVSPVGATPKKHKKRTKSSKHSSSTSRSESISTPPPHQSTFPTIAEHDRIPSPQKQFVSAEPTHPSETVGFPSVGFGGGRISRKNSEAGVFLATRGD